MSSALIPSTIALTFFKLVLRPRMSRHAAPIQNLVLPLLFAILAASRTDSTEDIFVALRPDKVLAVGRHLIVEQPSKHTCVILGTLRAVRAILTATTSLDVHKRAHLHRRRRVESSVKSSLEEATSVPTTHEVQWVAIIIIPPGKQAP